MATLRAILRQLAAKGFIYWVWAAVLLIGGVFVGDWISREQVWIELRYRLHQRLSAASWPRQEPRFTAIVLIEDEDFWGPELAGRSPLHRDYLARLLCAIDDGDPAVLALDVDLRAPYPDGSILFHERYRAETISLLESVRSISGRRAIVLASAIGTDDEGHYVSESNVYDGFDFEEQPSGRATADSPSSMYEPHGCSGGVGRSENVLRGFIALPHDMRTVPLFERLEDGRLVESLSLASAVAMQGADRIEAVRNATVRYGSYLPVQAWREVNSVYSAGEILRANHDERRRRLAHKVVLIGGAWSSRAIGRGPMSEALLTPAGVMPGVFVHANYIEALLASRVYTPLSKRIVIFIEVAVVFIAAIVFALEIRPFKKLMLVALLSLALLTLNYFFLQNLGEFFDGFVPITVLFGHSVVDKVSEWRHDALEHRKEA